ncbi:efflux RND transporter periplasmic adaptor subunit [Ideonella sp. DXS22W]|uniref:Efflux RND transporter periplasmic adaptor subunit n=1 Tax=Pseudaquabacterium inlustre TaxID=2984192 RepID=A0ABU9CIS4_9BURK
MGIKHRHSFAAGLTAAALSIAALAAAGLAQAATPVPTVVTRGAAAAGAQSLDGVLQPVRQATLAAQVGGNVVALLVKAGDRVKAGQPVARVDERELQAGVLRSEAGVAQAEAEWRNAKLAAERARELRGQGFVSQAALDQAETTLKGAQAGVAQAQAGRAQASLARGFTTVAAPYDAVVLATHVEAGDLATPGRAIATVYAPGALRAVVQVPASLAAAARGAQQVQVELADGQRVTPVARNLLPGADAVSQTVEWRLDLPAELAAKAGAGQPLLPGQQLRVHFQGAAGVAPAPAADAPLMVPAAAVLRRGELTAVYVAQGPRFVLRAVRTGASRGADGIEILAGVKPGERLAADAVRAGLADATPATPATPTP